MQDQAQQQLNDSGHGDSVGETGFAEGMIPVWGSGRDLINDVQTGDGWGAAMNAGFLVWDVVSIAAGCVTFGAATVAMQGAKTGLKATIKAGGKVIAQSAMKTLGKTGLRNLSKAALKESMQKMAAILKCIAVKGCFTGETLVHTKNGLKQIKDIKIGDEVYSYNEENNVTTTQKVVSLFEDTVEEILEIETEKEIIRTTRNHPFFVNGEFKDAEQIEIGEYLFSKNEENLQVISLNYIPETTKIYNFEVQDDHCYFVGEEGILVLNACHIKTFFDAFPHLKGLVSQVHHAIPQKVFKKWPELFDKTLKNSLENLRGIPKDGAYALHQGKIHKEWNKFYKAFEKSGLKPTKEQVESMVKKIDDTFGQLFNPPIK
jgi:DNA-binding protein YbaB